MSNEISAYRRAVGAGDPGRPAGVRGQWLPRIRAVNLLRAIVAVSNVVSARLAGRIALRLMISPRRRPRPAWEQALARRGEKSILPNGAAALSWGRGRTVLLVHGWESRGTQLGAFVDPLVARGFRVVAVDAPAHGDTPGRRFDPVSYARFLADVGDAVDRIHAVIAHSVGGASTTLAMRRGLAVRRAVLIASPSSLPVMAARFAAWLGLSAGAKRHFLAALERTIAIPPADVEAARIVAAFDTPALLLHDPEDREVPFAASEATARAWRGARLIPVPGTGHRGILKSPRAVAEVVRFIAAPARNPRAGAPWRSGRARSRYFALRRRAHKQQVIDQ